MGINSKTEPHLLIFQSHSCAGCCSFPVPAIFTYIHSLATAVSRRSSLANNFLRDHGSQATLSWCCRTLRRMCWVWWNKRPQAVRRLSYHTLLLPRSSIAALATTQTLLSWRSTLPQRVTNPDRSHDRFFQTLWSLCAIWWFVWAHTFNISLYENVVSTGIPGSHNAASQCRQILSWLL